MSTEKANKVEGVGFVAEARPAVPAPLSDVQLIQSLSVAQTREFVARTETQARIRQIVRARLARKAPDWLVDELVQRASVEALEANVPPRSLASARGWVGTITVRAVVHYFRGESGKAKWFVSDTGLEGDTEPDESPAAPSAPTGPARPAAPARDDWMLRDWLASAVADSPRDQEAYELLLYKARTGKTYPEVAADHDMTEGALKSRIHVLKTKYEPRWRKRQRGILLLLLLLLGAVVAIVAWLFTRPPRAEAVPDVERALPRVAPTPSAVPDEPFHQALPTAPSGAPPRSPAVPDKPPSDGKR